MQNQVSFTVLLKYSGVRTPLCCRPQQVWHLEADDVLVPERFVESCQRTCARRVSFKTNLQTVTKHHEQTVVTKTFGRGQIRRCYTVKYDV